MTEGFRTVAVAFVALGAGFAWQAVRTSLISPGAPDRLVAELRLSQVAALLLVLTAGAYVGIAVVHENVPGVGFDVAFAIGFFVVAATAILREPRQALTLLALGFAAHAILDVAHRPGLLPGAPPRWYLIGCAIYDACIGALCYLPLLRR